MSFMKFSKRFKFRLALGIILLIGLSQLTTSCFQFRMNRSQVKKYFQDQSLKPTLDSYKVEDWNIHYAEIGSDTLPMVVFLHGAPGSWSAFRDYFKDSTLYSLAHLVSVDRPGYGYSNFGRPETSLKNQALLLKPILKKNQSGKPAILVGHSLGGPVAAWMAIHNPILVGSVIMVAPSIAPELEPEEWYRLPLYLPIIRWILPTTFDMTNREIYHLKDELESMLPSWKNIQAYTTVIQGGKDKLVHPGNADFAKKMIVNAPVELIIDPEMGHFVPWTHPNIIKETIFKHLDLLKTKSLTSYDPDP